jgi:SAM-dependent methyltransferase
MGKGNYLLENSHYQSKLRLEAISALFDEISFQHMRQLGLGTGWRCWEVGGGSPNLPIHISQEIGSTGLVVATDIDVTWLKASSSSNLTVVEHDVVRDHPPAGQFDLVHARLLLVHLPERQAVLQRLTSALRPGGWLLIEDADPALQPLACIDESGAEQVLANKIRNGFRQLMADRGVDLAYGRTLPRVLREAGLQDLRADGFFPFARPECNQLERATIELLRTQLIEQKLASSEEIEANLDNLAKGRIDVTTAPMVSAWGHCAVAPPEGELSSELRR